jgi:hypothetical protein
MNTDSQKKFQHPEGELKEIEETLSLSVELLQKGYEEDGEVKPWTNEAVSQILETITEALSKKQDIFEEISEFEKAGDIANAVDNIRELNEGLKDEKYTASNLLEKINLLLK